MAGLAPKGSMSSKNKQGNAPKTYNPNNIVDRKARAALSKTKTARKLDGAVLQAAHPKTIIKAQATLNRRTGKR